ncbi:hypothetical protein [Legionella massiliensis]|nr:hypothetical protein [Legionella massiliensis]
MQREIIQIRPILAQEDHIEKNTKNEGRNGNEVFILVYSVIDDSSFEYIQKILPY